MSADEGGDTTPMSTTHDEPHQDSATIAGAGKRKRSTQDDKPNDTTARDQANLHETLRNLIELLLKHDSDLQLLSCPFQNTATKPRAKRAKVSGDQDASTIRTRVASDKYSTLQEFLADIERASAAVIERNQTQSNGTKVDGAPVTEVVNQIAAFKIHMNSLIGQSFVNQPEVKTEISEDDNDSSSELHAINVCARDDKRALTLFGNSANPKHLFSSLQKSVKVPLQSDSGPEKFVEVQEELREAGLPNGITTTKVVPFNLAATPKPSKRTFGEVFAPRESLLKLEPPRKRSHRGNAATWVDRFDATFDSRNFLGERSNYCLAPLPSTQWLQYGGVTSSPSYWDRVEKQHGDPDIAHRHGDPALWNGPDVSAFLAPAQLYSSLRRMLSGGANGGAHRVNTLLSIPYEGEGEEENTEAVRPGNIGDLDESILDEMVTSFNAEDFAANLDDTKANGDVDDETKTVNELLGDVSDLLNTLSSYQRLRSLNPPTGQQGPEADETPVTDESNTPSDAEFGVYETLKASLVAVISNLPPYAVAKLDGHQLAELNISQRIVIETPDYNGTMEKDDYTLSQERAAALVAAANAAGRTATPSSARPTTTESLNPKQASRLRHNPPRQPSAPNTYAHAYSAGRPPSTPSQRPANTPQYSQGTPQYGQGSQAPYQRPSSNGYLPGQASAQGTPQPYTPRPGQPTAYNGTPQGRIPYATATANSTQRPPTSSQTPGQPGYVNSAAAATYSRSAAEQAALMDRNKAQLAARQTRHSPSTPQPQGLDPRASQEGSATPGAKQNGTPLST
ncbi:uncharacterized protein N7506_009730 [Penicillium brevicompactum]|uniref:uncharacterized protein n=1 Tax=Penicillium brevicompactum TaxID=5074 RepID=UPI002540397A|nr:uncharacterized protein N7506_009730 [Penicillium brevicompactum]KAJ5326628.1 hypothetical protein N7506_009730 [Penicillium brevicompactum]